MEKYYSSLWTVSATGKHIMQHENNTHFEIERRFLIRFPQADYLAANAKMTEIVQTYLLSEKGETNRVRKRGAEGVYEYTHTIKRRISSVRRIEQEQVITEEKYVKLLKLAGPQRRTIEKERWCLDYLGQTFEIDIFPFWRDRAIMELELRNERQEIIFPPQIEIIKEITDDGRYTNAALAKSVPYDEIWREHFNSPCVKIPCKQMLAAITKKEV